MLFPITWIIVLPGNFIIDSLVLIIAMHCLKIDEKKSFYKTNILKIFIFGMLADIIGAAYMIILAFGFEVGRMADEWYLTVPAVFIAAIFIFLFNYFITFKKYEKRLRLKLALTFAIATAPYTFMFPSKWLYGY